MGVEKWSAVCYNNGEMNKGGAKSLKKRIICLLLSAVLVMSMIAISASAESGLSFSADALKILKAEEGFSSKPYWDYAQWTVGYGTKCPDDKVEYYTQNGITEAEAEALLHTYIARFQSEVEKFIAKTGVTLNQNQFDALVLFSFNCGSAWTYDSNGGLYNAIASGATGNTLIDAFTRWCNAGGQIRTFLLRRRLCEANMYLNGVYSQTIPDHYGYVLYDPCGGTVSPNVQGYDANLTSAVSPKPAYSGYTFQGWYTARVGGQQVTVLDASVRNGRLYAHWLDGAGKDPAQDTTGGVTVTVTANGVNIRQGPGTNYKATGTANTGEQLVITETATGTGYTWGKFYGGWICLDYTNYDDVSKPEPETPTIPESSGKRTGTVKVNDQLRVRSGPSTGYGVVGYLKNGARVEILEQKIAGAMVWGKISNGWISLDYVVLDPVAEQTPPATEPPATEPPATEPPATEPPATEPQKPVQQSWTGTVKVNDLLRVRSGPSTSTKVVDYLSPNERVTITEQTSSGSMTWGKTAKGWISMDYVVLDKQGDSGSSGGTSQKVIGTVKVNDYLRVRTGPGTSYAIAGYLSPNTKVEITEQKTVGGTVWGKTDKGWISLDYVVLDQQNTGSSGGTSQPVAKTVTADCLRVRSEAGTSNKIVGYLYEGAKVQILETTQVNGVTWGRISKGWISMDYVK